MINRITDYINNKTEYTAEIIVVNKNGEDREGIQIWKGEKGNIVPVVYPQNFPTNLPVSKIAEQMIETVKEASPSNLPFDPSEGLTWDNIKSRVYPCAGNKKATSNYVNTEVCEDVHEYVRIFFTEELSTAVTPELLKSLEITENELFEAAEINGQDSFRVISFDEKLFGKKMTDTPLMVVIESEVNAFGAAGLFFTDYLEEACDMFGVDEIIIAPSSIQEVICMPGGEFGDAERLKEIVEEINSTELVSDEYFTYGIFTFKRGDFMFERG